jgi:hypothetical protein
VRVFCIILLAIVTILVTQIAAIALPKDCIIINIPSRTLDLYKGGKLINTYPVGVGRSQFQTPVGEFSVIRKVLNPGWENPYKPVGHVRIQAGHTNPLGTRWIGFKADNKGEYGIHGTDMPSSVGKFSSHGCVRMQVKDAEEIFEHIEIGTPVLVTYNTVRVHVDNQKVFISHFPDEYKKGETTINKLRHIINDFNHQILWNASIALQALNTKATNPIKIGTIIDETDFY